MRTGHTEEVTPPGEQRVAAMSPSATMCNDGTLVAEAEPSASGSGLGSALSRASAWLRAKELDEVLIVSSLLALCVLVKVLWLTPVDMYWDAGAKWHFVRQWSYANDFSHAHWSHHMARFGVNVPAYFAQLLFGSSARVYYVTPVALFTIGTLFVFATARRLAGLGAGVLGALFMTFFTGMTRSASQLLPDGIAGTAAVIAGYAFVRFHEEQGKARARWLVGIGLACVWAYAIKESSVLLFPGVVVAVWLSRRSYKEAALLIGVLALYALLETAGFRLFTPYAHRLAVVNEEHGLYPPMTFFELFGRFASLDAPFQMLFWLWVASVLVDLSSGNRTKKLFLLLPLGFVFCLTFAIRRVNPIVLWESFKPRYMAPAGPLFVVSVSVLLASSLKQAWGRLEYPRLRLVDRFVVQNAALSTFGLCVALGLASYLYEQPHLKEHPLVTLRQQAQILNDAFRRNLPIVEQASNPRGLNTVYAVYMRAEYLAQSNLAVGGRLPDIQEAVRFLDRRKRHAFILRDDSAYRRGELQALIDAGCAVTVRAGKTLTLSTGSKLPEECKAPRGETLPVIQSHRWL
jgi:hypothetical protein